MALLAATDEMKLPPGKASRQQGAEGPDQLELLLRVAEALVEEASHRENERLSLIAAGREGHRRIDDVALASPPAVHPSARELRDRHDLLVGHQEIARRPGGEEGEAPQEPGASSPAYLDGGQGDAEMARVAIAAVAGQKGVGPDDERDGSPGS